MEMALGSVSTSNSMSFSCLILMGQTVTHIPQPMQSSSESTSFLSSLAMIMFPCVLLYLCSISCYNKNVSKSVCYCSRAILSESISPPTPTLSGLFSLMMTMNAWVGICVTLAASRVKDSMMSFFWSFDIWGPSIVIMGMFDAPQVLLWGFGGLYFWFGFWLECSPTPDKMEHLVLCVI